MAVFDEIGHDHKLGIIQNGLNGCPPLANIYLLNSIHPPSVCHDLVVRQIEYVRSHAITDVFLSARWSLYTDGSYRKGSKIIFLSEKAYGQGDQRESIIKFRKAIKGTIDIYRSMGVRVHFLTQAPMQLYNPKHIYSKWYDKNELVFEKSLRKFSVPYSVHSVHQKVVRSILFGDLHNSEASVIDMDRFFCDIQYCIVGTPKHSYYSDFNHLSSYGALKIKSSLLNDLKIN